MVLKVCSIEGCSSPARTRGYCSAHYRRLWRHGSPTAGGVIRTPSGGLCSALDCGKPAAKRGLCNGHYIRLQRRGTLEATRRTKPNVCGHDWCPGAKKIDRHMHYVKNDATYKARAEEWRQTNPEQYQRKKSEYLQQERVQVAARAKAIKWRQDNPEKKKAADRVFIEANRALVTSYKAARRARVLQATPSWLTEAHWDAIRAVYREAQRLTTETGIPHEVDHIVPLRGKTVCGLHVPWNLRAIPAMDNNRRPRVWTDTEIPA